MVLDQPEVTEQAIDVCHEPTRLLAADFLERVSDSHADDLVRVVHGREQVL